MLSRVKPELVFTSFKSSEIYQFTAIWSNHYFRGGGFNCMIYQTHSKEKFNLLRIFLCVIFSFELKNVF